MSEPSERTPADHELIRAVWDEARDLIKRLEGSTVQRLAVEAGNTRIEIERGMPAGVAAPAVVATAQTVGADGAEPDGEYAGLHPVKAPLVGTFYRSSQPGADPFVKEADVVQPGQTVAIVEAMKLMNQVAADAAGTVAAIVAEDGQWVEFEQVLMYLEPTED
jgi:acetyl-CoA carboxylase biotin carboxyl carrier protein